MRDSRPRTSSKKQSAPAARTGGGGSLRARLPRIDKTLTRIALVFVLVFTIFDAIIYGLGNTMVFYELRRGTAIAATALVHATGVPATLVGTRIHLSTRILQIDPDCTGLLVVAIFAALIIAYPVTWRVKGLGLLVGVPAVLSANMVRLVAVAHASDLLPAEPFLFLHDFLFKVFMVAVVVGLWAWWMTYARRQARG